MAQRRSVTVRHLLEQIQVALDELSSEQPCLGFVHLHLVQATQLASEAIGERHQAECPIHGTERCAGSEECLRIIAEKKRAA